MRFGDIIAYMGVLWGGVWGTFLGWGGTFMVCSWCVHGVRHCEQFVNKNGVLFIICSQCLTPWRNCERGHGWVEGVKKAGPVIWLRLCEIGRVIWLRRVIISCIYLIPLEVLLLLLLFRLARYPFRLMRYPSALFLHLFWLMQLLFLLQTVLLLLS